MKTCLAPGSKVVTEYLPRRRPRHVPRAARLQHRRLRLHDVHRQQRPAPRGDLRSRSTENDLVVAAVLSGNRNFEGRVHAEVRANYLASPPLVVAYALAGTMDIDLATEPLGKGKDGKAVFLKDIWPTRDEVDAVIGESVQGEDVSERLRRRLRRRRALARARHARGRALRVGPTSRPTCAPAVLRGHAARAAAGWRHRGRALPRDARRQHHDRPHLARRRHQDRLARPASTSSSTASSARTSTRTARAAATTR